MYEGYFSQNRQKQIDQDFTSKLNLNSLFVLFSKESMTHTCFMYNNVLMQLLSETNDWDNAKCPKNHLLLFFHCFPCKIFLHNNILLHLIPYLLVCKSNIDFLFLFYVFLCYIWNYINNHCNFRLQKVPKSNSNFHFAVCLSMEWKQ